MLATLLTGARDGFGQLVEFGGREFGGVSVEQGAGGLCGRAPEEGVDEMAQGGFASLVRADFGEVDVARAVFLVLEVAFILQGAELGADGGVTGRVGHGGADFGGGGAAEAEEDVHDLPLAAAEAKEAHRLVFPQCANFSAVC